MKRYIHSIYNMVACDYKNKLILLTFKDFNYWFERLLPELEVLESARAKMTLFKGMRSMPEKELERWQTMFCDRLFLFHHLGLVDDDYEFEGEEAVEVFGDYLEAYRYTYLNIAYTSDWVVTDPELEIAKDIGEMELITISMYEDQTWMDRLFRRFGKAKGEIKILRPAIEAITGTFEEFCVHMPGRIHEFSKSGIETTVLEDDETLS